MSYVKAKPGESIDSLLRRFKKAVDKSGILSDYKKNEFYEKPSIQKKKKQIAARKRALKKEKKLKPYKDKVGKNKNFKWNKDHTKKIPLPKYKPRPNTNSSTTRYQSKNTRGKRK